MDDKKKRGPRKSLSPPRDVPLAALDKPGTDQPSPEAPTLPPVAAPTKGVVGKDKERRLSLLQMKELAESQMQKRREEMEQQETRRTKSTTKVTVVACIVVAIVAAAILLVFVFFSGPKRSKTQAQVIHTCNTLDCHHHQFLIFEGLNREVDPCENFTEHVCNSMKWAEGLVSSTEQFMMTNWIKNGAAYLGGTTFYFNVTKKAVALFASCKNTRQSELEDMQTFMRDRGLSWPKKTTILTRHPLDVVLDLYINWGVVFWFEVSLLSTQPGAANSISFSRSGRAELARERLFHVRNKMSPVTYAKGFYNIYNDVQVNETDLETLLQVESAILDILVTNAPSRPRKILLRHIQELTPNIFRDRDWIPFLNRNLGSHKVAADDQVLLQDQQLLVDVNTLFRRFSHVQLLDHLSWWFAQEYLILATTEASGALHAHEKSRDSFLAYDCYAEVENHYKALLFMERRLKKEQGAKDTSVPREIIDSAVRLLEKNETWALDKDSREAARKAVREVSLLPRLPDSYGHASKYFEGVYSAYPSSDTAFIRLWNRTALAYRNTSNWPLNNTLRRRPAAGSAFMEYDTWLNSIFVHEGAFSPPSFYENGLHVMNYAGLGTHLALQLVRAFDVKNIQADSAGNRKPNATKRLRGKPACEDIDHQVLLQVAAVQIALDAYVAGGGEKSSSFQFLDTYSLEQVFFYTHCKAMCGQGDHCTETLRHLEEFRNAFECPSDSFMSPSQQCRYFD